MVERVSLVFFMLAALLPGPVAAQTRPSNLSTLFEDVFGPNGLVVSSDDVLLDGLPTPHTSTARSNPTSG